MRAVGRGEGGVASRAVALLTAGLLFGDASTVSAEAEPAEADGAAEAAEDESVGVNLELGYASAYVFRGLNLFQERLQLDQNMLLAPGASWNVAHTGLTLGYWSGYQITGKNISDNVRAGVSVEQDLYASYELTLPLDMALGFSFQGYFYPAADPDVAGASVPTYLEPAIAFSYSTVVELGLSVSYLAGVQSADPIADYRYLYLNPTVSKSLEVTPEAGLELQVGYGFKYFNTGNAGRDNIHDLLLSAALPIHPGGGIAYLTPGIAAAWTNIEDVVDAESGEVVQAKSFGDGFALWASVALGVDL